MLSDEDENRIFREKLKWRCRRGLLELDLTFEKFLSYHLDSLGLEDLQALSRLLALADNDIWDLITGKQQASDLQIGNIVNLLQSID